MFDWEDECKEELKAYYLDTRTQEEIKKLKLQIMKDKLQEYQDLLNATIEYIEQNKPGCKSVNWDEGDEKVEDFVNELENIMYGS